MASFNLNNLVNPECGAPNPLVAATRQIAMRPSTSTGIMSVDQLRPSRQIADDLTKQFIQQGLHQNLTASQIFSHQQRPVNSEQIVQPNISGYGYQNFIPLQQHTPMTAMQANKILAGDQLEEKYRNDLIAMTPQQESREQPQKEKIKERTDDVEFWQSLSQSYIGPTTLDRLKDLKLTPTNEYIFEERNPLKDQFDDPFGEGIMALERGDIPSAALLFEAAVQKEPENSAAWRYLGLTQAQNEKDSAAIRALQHCLNLDPTDQQARLAISVSLANETQHHQASEHLLEWLIQHDEYKIVGASLEHFREFDTEISDDPFYINSIEQKHYCYVRDKFMDAARLSPNNPDPDVQCSLGVLFNMSGEYDKAVDCFKAALSVKADDSLLWNRLGATLANGNKSDEAVIAYRKALEISPGFLRSRYNLAISLIHLNIYDEAAKQLVQILNMQAAGKGTKNAQIRTRSITSTSIWNTLRTVVTLLNKPELYPIIDGRDLSKCNEELFRILPGGSGLHNNIGGRGSVNDDMGTFSDSTVGNNN